MYHWWSPGGALVDVATFHNPKQQSCQYSETVVHLLYVQKHIYTNGTNSSPAVGYFLISLTDDDVLEDVRVVVRCGCHCGAVTIKKQHQSPEFWRTWLASASTPFLDRKRQTPSAKHGIGLTRILAVHADRFMATVRTRALTEPNPLTPGPRTIS